MPPFSKFCNQTMFLPLLAICFSPVCLSLLRLSPLCLSLLCLSPSGKPAFMFHHRNIPGHAWQFSMLPWVWCRGSSGRLSNWNLDFRQSRPLLGFHSSDAARCQRKLDWNRVVHSTSIPDSNLDSNSISNPHSGPVFNLLKSQFRDQLLFPTHSNSNLNWECWFAL